MNGRRFTGSNGNSLFLPVTGYVPYGRNYLYEGWSFGTYWSSSLWTNNPSLAWRFCFYSDSQNLDPRGREYGLAVRAVRQK